MATHRIHVLLEEGGIEWRQPISWFVNRYGVSRCSWLDTDIILVTESANIVPNLLRPLAFQAAQQWAPGLPPTSFWGLVYSSPDWSVNLYAAYAALTKQLGPSVSDNTRNTRGWRWNQGNAELKLTSWPPDLQFPGVNLMHERDPRTKVACTVGIETGFRLDCTPAELDALRAFEPFDRMPDENPQSPDRFRQYDLEYLRASPGGFEALRGMIGRANDALVVAGDPFYWMPLSELKAIRVMRSHPGRGSGSSEVALLCRSAAAHGTEKSIAVARHARTDGLDAWADRLAARLGCDLRVENFDDD